METDLTGRIANRPVPKHEEEVVTTNLAKTSLLVPKNGRIGGQIAERPMDRVGVWQGHDDGSGEWKQPRGVGQNIGLTTVRSVQTRLKSSATVSRYLYRVVADRELFFC